MSPDEAVAWLRSVRGQLYRNNRHPSGRNTWVAVVRTPREGLRNGKLIVALGETIEEAACAAEGRWRAIWRSLGRPH